MTAVSTLGDYLKARRELLRPADVGLPEGGRRRVQGLRGEDVAMLAGISVEYYLRLEQGSDQHPSDQVLDSIASALQLEGADAEQLRSLARPEPVTGRRSARATSNAGSGIQTLIDSWPTTPAYVQDRSLTIIAANPLAIALSPFFAPGSNPVRAAFLEPEMRAFYPEWDAVTARTVPYLRSVIGATVNDPRLVTLIGELSLGSERFRALWASEGLRHASSGLTRMLHPQVGPLEFAYRTLDMTDDSQVLITYTADPGSESAERLQLLATLT